MEGDTNETTAQTFAEEIAKLINDAIAGNIPELAALIAELGDAIPDSANVYEQDEGVNATGNGSISLCLPSIGWQSSLLYPIVR